LILAFVPYVLSFVGAYFRMQAGGVDNKHPRQQAAKLEGAGARAYAAQANAWEALGFFTALVAVLHFANPEAARGSTAANLSLLFLATRILHPIVYIANLDLVRSLLFLIGLLCGAGLLWIAA
jgi:uncharacterized MAPEG superfamily protein